MIRPAVMLYMRFTLFFRNVDDLLHRRAISVAYDPLTDIGLADQTAYDPSAFDMLPQIGVRCLAGRDEKPFELVEPETR